ncbi:MAG: sodium/substrate symporter small subunit [Akkermansiaceae bacterium]|jgi:uncharacterized membrane protein|nr:DUF4212 domain-containing protein [Luteolibacter sp.]
MTRIPSEEATQQFWKANLRWLAILLSIWVFVYYGCGIFFVVSMLVSLFTLLPPKHIEHFFDSVRSLRAALVKTDFGPTHH